MSHRRRFVASLLILILLASLRLSAQGVLVPTQPDFVALQQLVQQLQIALGALTQRVIAIEATLAADPVPPPPPPPPPSPVPDPPPVNTAVESARGTLALGIVDHFGTVYSLDTANAIWLGSPVLRNGVPVGAYGVHFYYGHNREVLFQTKGDVGYWYGLSPAGAVNEWGTLMPAGEPPAYAVVIPEATHASPDGTLITEPWTPLTIYSGRTFLLSDTKGTKDGGAHFIGYEVGEVFDAIVPGLAETIPYTPATLDFTPRPPRWIALDETYHPITDGRPAVKWALIAGEEYGYAFKLLYLHFLFYSWADNNPLGPQGHWYAGRNEKAPGAPPPGFVDDPLNPPPPEVLPAPAVGQRGLVGGWRLPIAGGSLQNPGSGQGGIAIDFVTRRLWVSTGIQGPGPVLEFHLPDLSSGTDPSTWATLQPTRTIPAWWDYGYTSGLLFWRGKLWAAPKVYYDTAPPQTMVIIAEDGESLTLNLPRQAFAGFVKRGPGLDPFIGAGGDESGSGGTRGPSLATLDGQRLIEYGRPFQLAEPGDPLAHWNDVAPREPNYFAEDGSDGWLSFEPRVINGVLEGRWAADRVFGGGLVLPEGVTFFPWMGTGPLNYGRQEPTFGAWSKRRTYRYRYDATTYQLIDYEKTGLGEVRGQELGPDGTVYLSFLHQWADPSLGVTIGAFR